ncbi:MAG: TolC family protein [Candidatus Endonucleobacter bathymodioli]|uniref:TolC family protein n=1 Tax=Candidatus Endonucleibacter bathymodioli TaxID=539814 RepID=A0AA90P128_9GAMM|nr:TolC family protein [Candidatus Endonucleobacter bathymodioli]
MKDEATIILAKNTINTKIMEMVMRMTYVLSIAIALFLVTLGRAAASSFECYLECLSNHPRIMSILSTSKSSQFQAKGELGLPDPVFSFGVDNVPISDPAFDRFLPTSKIIGFNQKIPNPILLRAKSNKFKQLSEKQILMADYMYQRLKFMLITKLAEYQSIKTQQELIKKQLKLYKDLEKTFNGKIKSGRAIYQRFSEIDVERAEAERNLNNLEASLISIEAEFINLIDEIPTIYTQDITDQTWDKNPNKLYPVLIAKQDVDIAMKAIDIANAAFLPNFGINVVYKQRENGKNKSFSGDDWFSVQAQITMPLWASSNQKPKLKAALEKKNSAEFEFDNTRRSWIQKMKSLQSTRDASSKNILILQDKDHAMRSKIDAAQRNYEAGTTDLDVVLLARIDRFNIQAQLIKVKSQHTSNAAEFNSNIFAGSYTAHSATRDRKKKND